MSGINGIASLRSTTSQGRGTRRGYMVAMNPVGLKSCYLTDSVTGHMWWWQREGRGTVEKRLLEEYGTVARWNGALGVRFILKSRAIVMLTRSYRKSACGSPTPRLSTIFSRLLVTSMKNHPTPGRNVNCSWAKVLPG